MNLLLFNRSLPLLLLEGFHIFTRPHFDFGQNSGDIAHDRLQHFREHIESFAFIFLLRIFLRITPQMDPLPQVIHCRKMLLPVSIQNLQHDGALELTQPFRPYLRFFGLIVRLDRLYYLGSYSGFC